MEERRELFKQWFECGIDTGPVHGGALGPSLYPTPGGLLPEESAWTWGVCDAIVEWVCKTIHCPVLLWTGSPTAWCWSLLREG